MIQAILFDLDGVLIKTELETFHFYQRYLKEHYNIDLPDSAFKYKFGRKSKDFFHNVLNDEQRRLIDVEQLTLHKRHEFSRDLEKFVTQVAGVEELLRWLREQRFTLALCSQNERPMIDQILQWLQVEKYFDITLSLQDISHKKPHPEIYQKAAERLKLTADQCLVIEDSKDGVEAAKNAHMRCIGVAHEYTPEGYLETTDFVVHSLKEIPAIVQRINQ